MSFVITAYIEITSSRKLLQGFRDVISYNVNLNILTTYITGEDKMMLSQICIIKFSQNSRK